MPPTKAGAKKKKKLTGKALKAARRAATEAAQARRSLLTAAADPATDHLGPLHAFSAFKRNGLALKLTWHAALEEPALTGAFDLLKANMERHYIDSHWGWDDRGKLAELKAEAARFILVRDEAEKLVGFMHVRFDWEEDDLVLYVYEIQLAEEVRRKGLGKFLMSIAELIARRAQMDGVMLTVLATDADAAAFYRAIGYTEVYSTEEELDPEGGEPGKQYALMSKDFRPDPHASHSHDEHGQCNHDHH